MNRSALIRVPLGWSKLDNMASSINPQESTLVGELNARQTVELRSPDGSAIIHLLLAGIAMAAEWGATHDESVRYVSGNVFHHQTPLEPLPGSCVESARILLQHREAYERGGVFPPSIVEYVAGLLQAEDDERMNRILSDLPLDDRHRETRKLMHRDLHRH
jgi:glutamine synthetase